MTDVKFDPIPAARRLAHFWRGHEQLNELPDGERPTDLAQGYQVQRRLIEELNEPVRGYKLGLSSDAAMQRSGLGMPILGFVPQSRLHQSGDTIEMPPSGGLLLEAEIAFVIETIADIADLTISARLVFEVVRSRFAHRNEVDIPSFIGDASGFHALVAGDAIPLTELAARLADGASIWHDGKVVAAPLSGTERPVPLETFNRFLSLATQHRFAIVPGMIVATGSLVVPVETEQLGIFEARLGPSSVRVLLK